MKLLKRLFILLALSLVVILPIKAQASTRFTDVDYETSYAAEALVWAADNGVVSGETFSPAAPCTRATIIDFIWKSEGRPEAAGVSSFADVPYTSPYYNAINWGTSKKIVYGYSSVKFGIEDTVNRAQAVTFLWRLAGSPTGSPDEGFSDVPSNAYYRNAVNWAVSQGITVGTGNGRFSPSDPCQRQQIITFLYRSKNFNSKVVPAYSGSPYVAVHNNIPYFTKADKVTTAFETYSDLDSLGRCGTAFANICKDIMPTGERGAVGSIKPTAWHTVKYNGIDGNYLYNRCHLIGYQLAGENANEKNLITGTRYLNIQGMLPFENMVADYVKETDNHVLYRVTPVFEGSNLLASGVLIEAESVEDDGEGIQFCVYCYNVQPGITINYADGSSTGPEFTGSSGNQTETKQSDTKQIDNNTQHGSEAYYIGNRNTKKFHRPSCSSVKSMKESNKVTLSTRTEALSKGYEPCKNCKP